MSEECGFTWEPIVGETITYWVDADTGQGHNAVEGQAFGPHRCIKPFGHEDEDLNEEHRCCCGNHTWHREDL